MLSLIELLENKAIPWAMEQGQTRIIPTGAEMEPASLPADVLVTKRKLRGAREAVRGPRQFGRVRNFSARWSEDGLIETAGVPIIVCVAGGSVDFRVGENVIHCGEGHFLLIPPGVPHDDGSRPHYDFDPKSPEGSCDLLWINRCGRTLLCWTCHCRGAQHGSPGGTQYVIFHDAAIHLIDLLMDEATQKEDGWEEICQTHLLALLLVMRRELGKKRNLKPAQVNLPEFSGKQYDDAIEQSQAYIRSHLKFSPTIDQVAGHVYMSRTQFTQRFRRQTGQSFTEYLTQCRIEEAKSLLTESSWSVSHITQHLGLKSAPYFCRLFERHIGSSPQQFRNKAKDKNKTRL